MTTTIPMRRRAFRSVYCVYTVETRNTVSDPTPDREKARRLCGHLNNAVGRRQYRVGRITRNAAGVIVSTKPLDLTLRQSAVAIPERIGCPMKFFLCLYPDCATAHDCHLRKSIAMMRDLAENCDRSGEPGLAAHYKEKLAKYEQMLTEEITR